MSAVMDPRPLTTRPPSSSSATVDAHSPGGSVTVDSVPATKLSATERIEASRSLLRHAMFATLKPPRTPASASSGGTAKTVFDLMRHLPGASLIVDTLATWWARHPLRDASVIAREASGAVFRPMAQENPTKLVLGALVVGALLVVLKPWRFILRSALFAGLVPQFAALALRRLPLSTWIGMFARRSKQTSSPSPSREGRLRRARPSA